MNLFHDKEIHEILYLERENRFLLRRILRHLGQEPALTSIRIRFQTQLPFSEFLSSIAATTTTTTTTTITPTPPKENPTMSTATAGPVTLTSAGQTATASILGFDQFGNPWTGAIPPVTFAIDNAAIATSTPSADGVTDLITAVANGTANLTASLTTAEGLALTDTEQVIVNIPAPPPPPAPVLTSIKIGFSS